MQIAQFAQASGEKKLRTDNPERSFYDLYAHANPSKVFVPRSASLPFNSQYVSSSNFTNNTLSLSTLYAKDDDYNYLHENIPSLMNLQRPSFVGLTKGSTSLDVKLQVPRDDEFRLLLHAAAKGGEVQASLGGRPVVLEKLQTDQAGHGDFVDFTYFYADVRLKQGDGVLSIMNATQNAVVVDSVTMMPAGDVPKDFMHIETPAIQITPTSKELLYDVRIKRGK